MLAALGRWVSFRALVVFTSAIGFSAIGLLGAVHYVNGYWRYRGFDPPADPTYVTTAGTPQTISVWSPAVRRWQEVDVYLPPGYASHPRRRYPVLYLLHGEPGRPGAFLETVRMGVVEDELVARGDARPLILVMPFGSTGTFTDEEWANGVRPHSAWETFLARDVVHAIDTEYRTLPRGSSRGIGGLSEGGYGALNIALHHPGEFHVVESWSGYARADDLGALFDHRPALLRWNSPLQTLAATASALRRTHTYFWLYSGRDDRFLPQNTGFARLLGKERIEHRFRVVHGGHDWALWRGNAASAYLVASRHLARAS